jgi:two-component system chemotaxis response regulator CheB
VEDNNLKVLVVDDTIVYRKILKDLIDGVPGAAVNGTASNGRLALARLEHTPADLVVLDIEMPEMNGLEALTEIKKRWPHIGVVIVSASNRSQADLTMEALSRGALDFVPKAEGSDAAQNREQMQRQLAAVIRGFAGRVNALRARSGSTSAASDSVSRLVGAEPAAKLTAATATAPARISQRPGATTSAGASGAMPGAKTLGGAGRPPAIEALLLPDSARAPLPGRIDVVVVGSSTGGPQALTEFIPGLPEDLGVPVLVVQHMPPVFTASLAKSLDNKAKLRVHEAADGQLLEANNVYIAPGGRHMVVRTEPATGKRIIGLNDGPPENSVRPAVDVLFRSVALTYEGRVLSVILTGMGEDGARGVRALKQRGCYSITQSEESCVIYGMPRAVDQAGLSDESLALPHIAARVSLSVRNPRSMLAGRE